MTDRHDAAEFTFQQLVERIAARIRPVCPLMPEPEFRALIERMARIQQKYIHHPFVVPRRLADAAAWPDSTEGDP